MRRFKDCKTVGKLTNKKTVIEVIEMLTKENEYQAKIALREIERILTHDTESLVMLMMIRNKELHICDEIRQEWEFIACMAMAIVCIHVLNVEKKSG